jgi:serine/threonine protein kinase
VNVVTQVASALDAAHAENLAHRDIKPSNILVTNSENGSVGEFVYVADFGLARLTTGEATSLTRTGATVGSLGYMAPERFTGSHGDHRGDVYALGCLLFEALTTHWPFRAEGLPAIIHAHLHQPPPQPSQDRPDLPADLDTVVARAMAKNPDDRYPSAGALAAAARAAMLSPGTPQAVISESPDTTVPFSRLKIVVPDRQPARTDPGDQRSHNPRQTASTTHRPAHAQQQRHHLPRPTLITIAATESYVGPTAPEHHSPSPIDSHSANHHRTNHCGRRRSQCSRRRNWPRPNLSSCRVLAATSGMGTRANP